MTRQCSRRCSRPRIATGFWWSKVTIRGGRGASNRASPSATASLVFVGRGRSAGALPGCPGCTPFDGPPGHAPMLPDCSTRPIPSRRSRPWCRWPIGSDYGCCSTARRCCNAPEIRFATSGSWTCGGVCCSRSGANATPAGSSSRATTLRLVSLADRNLGLQLVRLEMEQGNAEVSVDARFDEVGRRTRSGTVFEQDLGVWRTEQSGKSLAIACTASLQLNDADLSPRALTPFRWSWNWASAPGQAASFQRMIAVARSDSLVRGPRPGSTRRARSSEADRMAWRARRT